ncbi:MAG TPA: hypothetical protein VGB89_00645 [Bacteroidota bacterium]
MRQILSIIGFLIFTLPAIGQEESYILSKQGSITVRPLFRSWSFQDQDKRITEVGTVFSVKYPASRILNFSLQTAQATTYGDFNKVSGWSDVQVGVAAQIERTHMSVSVGVNIPTGKTELTAEEFETAALVSNPVFDYRVPAWGQGFTINPGVAWVYEASRNVVVGFAGAYQYKGSYKPQKDVGEYNPGDEIVFTGGADLRLNESSSIALDVVFTTYGTDQLDGADVFAPGAAVSINGQYKKFFKNDELRLYARFRSKGKGDFPTRVEPNRTEIHAGYTIAASRTFSLGLLATARFFEETDAGLSGAKLFGFKLSPTFQLSPSVRMPFRLGYDVGSTMFITPSSRLSEQIGGFEVSIGLMTDF